MFTCTPPRAQRYWALTLSTPAVVHWPSRARPRCAPLAARRPASQARRRAPSPASTASCAAKPTTWCTTTPSTHCVTLATELRAPVVHTLHLPPERPSPPRFGEALGEAPGRRPTVACVSASRPTRGAPSSASTDAAAADIPTRSIGRIAGGRGERDLCGQAEPGEGRRGGDPYRAGRRIPIDVYGDGYDARYAREQIDPRRRRCPAWRSTGAWREQRSGMRWRPRASCSVRHDGRSRSAWSPPKRGRAARQWWRSGAAPSTRSIVDRQTGLLVAPDDIDAAADAVSRNPRLSARSVGDTPKARSTSS